MAVLRMARPMRRKGSDSKQFRQRIPRDILEKARGQVLAFPIGGKIVNGRIPSRSQDVAVSLRTSDPAEAKVRHTAVAAYVDRVWASLRQGPQSLTHKQIVALAGLIYREWVTTFDDEPGRPEEWESFPALYDDDPDSGLTRLRLLPASDTAQFPIEARLGAIVDRVVAAEALIIDADSRAKLLKEAQKALDLASEKIHRAATGDYSPDANASRFPEWTPPVQPQEKPTAAQAKVSLKGLVEDWWREAKATGLKISTYESYRNTMANFVAFLKHDDASRVTPENVIAFKDFRLASINPKTGRPISAKTVKDSDIAGLKSVFRWAKGNRKISTNPAEEVTLKVRKPPKKRDEKGLTEREALDLLTAAYHFKPGNETPETAAAKRWVPWLMAYSGARVGEMGQLRKEDICKEDAGWVMTVTPDAGTVKSNDMRRIVIHPHVIEQGFDQFISEAKDGHLFVRPSKAGDVRGPLRGLKNRLTEEARAVVTDPNVQPNHGWRHRFMTVGREVGIEDRILDAIQDHKPKTVGDSYGDVTLKAIANAIGKLPRYEIR